MNVREAYGQWAGQYDTNKNRTRDMEARVLRELLCEQRFGRILEIGCGTGKNSEYLEKITQKLVAVDLTREMLEQARRKVKAEHVIFLERDILQDWDFADEPFDLVTFSLVLEHIEHLDSIFNKVSRATESGSRVYLGELHPFKQYAGTKARYETKEGIQEVTCFVHHVSDFVEAAGQAGFRLLTLKEYFDEDAEGIPRILALLFEKI